MKYEQCIICYEKRGVKRSPKCGCLYHICDDCDGNIVKCLYNCNKFPNPNDDVITDNFTSMMINFAVAFALILYTHR